MDSARRTLQAMRAEENRLLADRVQVDQAAVRRLQFVSIALAVAASGFLAWIFRLIGRNARRQRQGADTLRQANQSLEAQVDASAADLRDSNARLRSIIDSAVDGIIVIDVQGRIEAFNPGAERLFGYPEPEVLGRNVKMLMPSPYHDEHDGYLDRYLHTGVAKIIGTGREVTGRRRDGSTFPLQLSVGEMSIKGERKFTGMLHDLTRRVRLEDELRASEARWRSVIDSAVDGIVVIDAHGRIEAFNPAAVRLFGYEEREVVGRNVNMLMPSPYHEEHDTYLARHLATGVQKIIGTGREVTGLRRDGTTFPLHLSVGKMTVGGEQRFTGILHDLSVRVRIEKQLREQTSLAKLGEMAAVIAHEVKNPLAGVRGAIQIIGTRLPKGSKDASIVTEIVSRIDTLNELMKDLLLFARPPQPKLAVVDIGALVTTTANLLRGDPAFEQVEVRVGGEPARALGDAELLKIVFVNLLVNAASRDAGTRNDPRVARLDRGHVSDCLCRRGAWHSRGRVGEDLHAVLHDQSARIGPGTAHRQAPHRGAPRHHQHRMSVSWWNGRDRSTAWRTPGRDHVGVPAARHRGPVLEDTRVVGRPSVAFAREIQVSSRYHEHVCVVFPYGRNFSSFARARCRG